LLVRITSENGYFSYHSASAFGKLRSLMYCPLDIIQFVACHSPSYTPGTRIVVVFQWYSAVVCGLDTAEQTHFAYTRISWCYINLKIDFFQLVMTVALSELSDAGSTPIPGDIVPPKFTQLLKDIDTVEGDLVRFDCRVIGHPTPTIKWYRGRNLVQNSADFQVSSYLDSPDSVAATLKLLFCFTRIYFIVLCNLSVSSECPSSYNIFYITLLEYFKIIS